MSQPLKKMMQFIPAQASIENTYRLPRFPIPLTSPMAAARLAGGRGIEFDTQTSERAKPTNSNI